MANPAESPRFALPLLHAGQAQKEITHNEALVIIDALIHCVVIAVNITTPPPSPLPGQCWAIGASPTGLWVGKGGQLAIATVGGWRFCAVPDGFGVRVAPGGALWRKAGSSWAAPASLSAPSGGTTSDSEARSAIAAILATLTAHGLIS